METEHECEHRKRVEELEAENAKLRAELEKLKKPKKNSANSSVAPSQDPYRKPYPKPEKSDRKQGGQPGHPGHYRPFSETPDEVKSLHPKCCPHCGSEEMEELPGLKEIRQEITLPEVQAKVTEYQQCRSLCKGCGKTSWGAFPETVRSPHTLSPEVEGLVGYLKVAHHQSNEKIQILLNTLYNLHLSRGTIEVILSRLQGKFQEEIESIQQGLRKSFQASSDETGIRIAGKRGYQFVFQNTAYCLYVSGFSRGYQVIESVFGKEFPSVWGSDRYNAQLKTPCQHQLCLAHILRECRYLEEAEQSEWANALKQVLKKAIDLRKSKAEVFDPLDVETFREIRKIKTQLCGIFEKPPPKPLEKKLFKGLLSRQEELLMFLTDPDIPFDNNSSERALRNRKTHLKVIGCFRSVQGAQRVDVISSLLETAKRQGKNALEVLCGKVQLFPKTLNTPCNP